jgi:DNA-binding CsgD family transcriptional regulator
VTPVETRSTVETRVEGSIGWVTPNRRQRASLNELQRDALFALADHITNPAVQTIVIAGIPAMVLGAAPGSDCAPDDVSIIDQSRRHVSDQLWRSSKTLILHGGTERPVVPTRSDSSAYVEPLTPRERQVLSMVSEGTSARAIGACLFISERTVESHVGNGYRKLGIRSRTELVRRAAEFGLCTPAPITF